MTGFDVDPPSLRTAAARLATASTAVGACEAHGDLATVPTAVRGCDADAAAGRLARAWETRFAAWADAARAQAGDLEAAADDYDAADTATSSALDAAVVAP